MNSILEQINSMGAVFVEFALPVLVQSSILIAILLSVNFLLRNRVRAVFRYWLWMLVLVKLVLPPGLSSPVSVGHLLAGQLQNVKAVAITTDTAEVDAIQAAEPAFVEAGRIAPAPLPAMAEPAVAEVDSLPAEPVVSAPPVTWQGALFLSWLMVVAAMMLLLGQRAMFVYGLVTQAKKADGVMVDTFRSCSERMRVKGRVGLRLSANAASPAVCGLFRPVVLLPQNLGSNMGPGHLQAVLLHELAHIKRGDLWVNLAQTLLQIFYFYNPLLWLANAVIRRVREQAVDESVQVAMGERARQYPQTLVDVAKLVLERPALSLRLIGVVESKSLLKERVKRMLSRPIPKTAKLGFVGLMAIIIIAAVLLPMAKAMSKPPAFVVKGTVTDAETGKTIAGAKVGDIEQYAEGKQWTTTDANGNYSYKTWYEEHAVKCEMAGYETQIRGFLPKLFGLDLEKERVVDFKLTPENPENSSRFIATLSNGVTVELVGVCKAIDNQRCWAPDGSLFSKAPYYKSGAWAGSEAFEFAFRVKNLDEEQSATSWKIDGKYATGSGNREHPTDEAGKEIADLWVIDAKIIEGVQKCDISFGVAASPWQAQAKCVGIQGMVTSKDQHPYTFSQAYVHNSMVCVTVSDVMVKLAKRLIAIDNNGNTHLSELVRTGSTKGLRQSTFGFKNLKLEDIKEFQFHTQPYEWTEFKNVSLNPNFKTDVQIEEKKVSPVGDYALEFDGVDDFLEIHASKSLQLGRHFTIQMWVRPQFPDTSSPDKERNLLSKGGYILGHPDEKGSHRAGTYGFGFKLIPYEESKIVFLVITGSDQGTLGVDSIMQESSDWLHLAVVFADGKNRRHRGMSYINTSDETYTYKPAPLSNIFVGGKGLTPMGSHFKGQIAELRIWNRELSSDEIAEFKTIALTGNEPNLVGCWTFEEGEGWFARDISPYKNRAWLRSTYAADKSGPIWVRIGAEKGNEQKPAVQVRTGEKESSGTGEKSKKPAVQVEGETIGGKLEFRILPNIGGDQKPEISKRKFEQLRKDLNDYGPDIKVVGYKWLEIGTPENSLRHISDENGKVVLGPDEMQWYNKLPYGRYKGQVNILVCDKPELTMLDDSDWALQKVYAIRDLEMPAIGCDFNEKGGELFYKLTKDNRGNTVATIIDGKIISALTITAAHNKGVIIGNFTEERIQEIADVLENSTQYKPKTAVQVEAERADKEKSKTAKTLKIVVYEGDKPQPDVTLNIPLAGLKIANTFIPEQAKKQMAAQGIDLGEILKQVDNGLEPTTLLDVKDGNDHVIISLE